MSELQQLINDAYDKWENTYNKNRFRYEYPNHTESNATVITYCDYDNRGTYYKIPFMHKHIEESISTLNEDELFDLYKQTKLSIGSISLNNKIQKSILNLIVEKGNRKNNFNLDYIIKSINCTRFSNDVIFICMAYLRNVPTEYYKVFFNIIDQQEFLKSYQQKCTQRVIRYCINNISSTNSINENDEFCKKILTLDTILTCKDHITPQYWRKLFQRKFFKIDEIVSAGAMDYVDWCHYIKTYTLHQIIPLEYLDKIIISKKRFPWTLYVKKYHTQPGLDSFFIKHRDVVRKSFWKTIVQYIQFSDEFMTELILKGYI